MKLYKIFIILIILLLLSCFQKKIKIKNNNSAKIYFTDFASGQTEIISPENIRVLINITDQRQLTRKMTEDDILLRNSHLLLPTDIFQENSNDLYNTSAGKSLNDKAGIIRIKDVTVESIPAGIAPGDEIVEEGSSTYIFVIQINNIKIVHFCNVGQDFLTEYQLKKLKNTDLLITQLTHRYSGKNLENKKSYNLIKQINPKFVVPTESTIDGFLLASEYWDTYYLDNPLIISKELYNKNIFKNNINFLIIGKERFSIAKKCKYKKWPIELY